MKVNELIKYLNMLPETYKNLEVSCSVDISKEGEEDTYGDRIFGDSLFLIQPVSYPTDSKVYLLFEKSDEAKTNTRKLK